jgi:predicted nucleic acid-binding protein
MGIVLDTSVLVGVERARAGLERFFESQGDVTFGISAITASELLHGCHRARDPATRARRAAFVEAVLEMIPILPFGLAEARRHAELWAQLAGKGSPVGAHDMIIGATALARGDAVATLNVQEFRRMPGVEVIPVGADPP